MVKKIASIGGLLKKTYRLYSLNLIKDLEGLGFNDLRPSFLEILIFISEHEGESINKIGKACGLKKQTMTSHLNELDKRGYVQRINSSKDKREQLVHLTDYGKSFKLNLLQVTNDLEKKYLESFGEIELSRVEKMLTDYYEDLSTILGDVSGQKR